MSTIMPEEKKVKDAVEWIAEHREQYEDIKKLVDDATFHFNLSPKQEQYLYHVFVKSSEE